MTYVLKIVASCLTGLLLVGCQTMPEVVNSTGDTFEIRYDPMLSDVQEVDELANRRCSGFAEFVTGRARVDTMKFRTYRCVDNKE